LSQPIPQLAGDFVSAEPFAIPPIVQRVRYEYDWAAVLPPRAASMRWAVEQKIKRVLDVVLAGAGLIVLSPILALIALLVRITSPGPILYEWRVLGRHARPFVGYKFRTMVTNAEDLKRDYMHHNEMTGPVFKMRNDPRVTPVGRFLRKFSLDELPQLWSVVKGDMSLVGPRPPSPEEYSKYESWQWGKLAVTPGITCLWQVSGRSTITDFNRWMTLDLQYIRDWTLLLDFRVIVMTLPAVVRGHGAY
jgi:lipopolysaccharide/colanic/teichoic acid biosynthesis glycosyltransferase